MENNGGKHMAAGILSIVSGAFGILYGIFLVVFIIFFMRIFTGQDTFYVPDPAFDEMYNMMISIYGIIGLVLALIGVLGIVGGVFALKRKHWGWS